MFVFWFNTKNQLQNNNVKGDIEPFHMARPELLDLRANSAQMRVWLPEHTRLVMDRVVRVVDATLSEYLREFFVVYLYGINTLIEMKQTKTGLYYELPPVPESSINEGLGISFSRMRSVEYIPELGKNIKAIKIFLNAQIKADLQKLANKASMPLSQFVREILVSHFSGHTVWSERIKLISVEQEALANSWEAGDVLDEFIKSPSCEVEEVLIGKIETIIL